MAAEPKVTLETDGDFIFAGGVGRISCYRRNDIGAKKAVWENKLKGAGYGFVAMLMHRGALYAALNGHVFKLAPSTGVELWHSKLGLQGGFLGLVGAPMAIRACGENVLVFCMGEILMLDTSEEVMWRYKSQLVPAYTHIQVTDDNRKIYIGSLNGVIALDAATGFVLWESFFPAALQCYAYSMHVAPNGTLVAAASGHLIIIDAADGRLREVIKESNRMQAMSYVRQSPLDPTVSIILQHENGLVRAMRTGEAAATGNTEMLWERTLGASRGRGSANLFSAAFWVDHASAPPSYESQVPAPPPYCSDDEEEAEPSESARMLSKAPGEFSAALLIGAQSKGEYGRVIALNPATGEEHWDVTIKELPLVGSIKSVGDRLYVVGGGRMVEMNVRTGEILARSPCLLLINIVLSAVPDGTSQAIDLFWFKDKHGGYNHHGAAHHNHGCGDEEVKTYAIEKI